MPAQVFAVEFRIVDRHVLHLPESIFRGDFGIAAAHLTEFYVLAGLISAMGIWRHHTNIKRLLSGTENKISVGGKDKK